MQQVSRICGKGMSLDMTGFISTAKGRSVVITITVRSSRN